MRSIKVVNREDLRKDHVRILGPLEYRIREIVAGILTGAEANLSRELHGIGLDVMRAVMELEILQVVGPKGKHHSSQSLGHKSWCGCHQRGKSGL
jgi:hypothetical protein